MSFLYCMLIQITCLVGIDCSARENNSLSLALGLWKYKLPVILIFFSILRVTVYCLNPESTFFNFRLDICLCVLFCMCKVHIWSLIIGLACTENREKKGKRGEGRGRGGGGVDSVCLIYIQLLPKSLRWMVSDKRKTDGKLYTQNRK